MSQIELPNPLSQIMTITKYELIKFIRGKKFHGILALSAVIAILFVTLPEIAGFDLEQSVNAYLSTPLAFLPFLLVISAAFLGSSSLVSEFKEKTGYVLFTNPVSRTSIWLGKFVASELVSFVITGIFYGIIIISALSKYGELPSEIFLSLGFSFVVVTFMMSFSFLASSFFRGTTGAMITVFLLFILILPIADQMLVTLTEIKPSFSPTFSSKIIEYVLTVPYPSDLVPGELPRGPFDHERFVPYISESLLVLSLYSILCCLASIVIFKRREMFSR